MRVAYGPHPSQVVDVHPPAPGTARGTRVTLLHGGFWRETYDRHHLAPLAAALAGQGLEVALAEYRRVGGGGGWPETFGDVVRAIGTGRGAAAPARHVVVGHSAGGHLALWAASAAATGVDRVIALAPVADLARARALGLSGDAVAGLVAPEQEHLADPLRLPPPRVPVAIVHGTDDEDVPVELSRAYAAAARAAGAAVDLTVLPGAGHYELITPGTPECARWVLPLTRGPHPARA
ncbi:prolyl oligopeptidase family serine peptidase [Streptomyces cinnamoneus]|uniref:Lipase/esterase n=1 Tax=Streptomyces cinnamoneus TaxID=53446 RepID=A0A918TCA0_STRCJ|nr:prolyl oligopeptidase family serine peptidase [Streptomyces cinnamoneus]GHC37629.1 putative lipase/esterase [Streptomyces cinnamoneus]